jgi:hypothetical protein
MSYDEETTRPNPFPGLRAFRPEEGHLFFGRIESIVKVVTRLKENRFVAVLGASGSGKSSLVLSGVIPALMKENAEEKKSWSYLVFRPELNPIDNLASELATLSAEPGFTQLPEATVAASLHNRSEGIIDIINKMRKNLRQQIVIVIDQFEEIFRYSPASTRGTLGDDATDFIDLIVNAVTQSDQGLYILLTIRSEYVSECSRFHSLTNLMNGSSYLLPQLTSETLSTVIEEPVKISGAAIDRSVVRMILSDLNDRQGQLPVLQHLLMRLWDQWSKSGDTSRPLSLADYEAVGRLKGAIAQHAGQAYELLDERHRYVCARLFRTITLRSEDGRELRKPERISTIASQTGCLVEEIIHVAEVFRSPEYSFLTPSIDVILNKDTIIDLTHESIIKLWGTLRKWLDDEEASKRIYLQLASAAAQYQEGNGKLWTAPDLLMAIKWREEDKPTLAWAERFDPAFERTMLFLKNSEEEYQVQEEYNEKAGATRIKRSRFFAGIFGILVIISLIALGMIHTLRVRAERQKDVAIQLKDEAVSYSTLLNDSLLSLADTLKVTALEADSARIAAVMEANRAMEAEERATEADRIMNEAVIEKAVAETVAAEEHKMKMLSVARSLAVRSVSHTGDQDLQILLAWQGYLFNDRYTGVPDDADLYSAFYDISKRYGNRYYSRVQTGGNEVTAMAQDLQGNYFYTADKGGRVLRWQSSQPSKGFDIIWSGDKVIEAMAVSTDATWLACGTSTSEIIMIPLTEGMLSYQLEADGGKVTALIFGGSGDHLYSSNINGSVALWDLKSHTSTTVGNEAEGVIALDISHNSKILAGLTAEGRLLLWHADSPGKPFFVDTGDRIITSLRFIPGEERLVTGDSTGLIDVWSAGAENVEATLEGHSASVAAIAFSNSDQQMLTGDIRGEIKIWSLADITKPPAVISDCSEAIVNMAFNKGDNAFVTVTKASVTQRPAHVSCMTGGLCSKVTRNLSPAEWIAYVGSDIEYEATCPDKTYRIKVREITQGGQ